MKLYFLLFFVPLTVFSQQKNNLSFSIDYSLTSSKMGMVNDYLADTSSFSSYIYGKYPTNTLPKTQGIGFEIGYQPFKFQDFSLGMNYLFCGIKRVPLLKLEDPLDPSQIITYKGEYRLTLNAFNFLIGSKTYFNSLFHFEENSSKLLQHIILASEYKIGFGFSKLFHEEIYKYPEQIYLGETFFSSDLNGQFNLVVGYKLNEGKIVSSINLKVGYQYYKTKVVRDHSENTFYYYYNTNPSSKPINLDFSGLNFGLQLTLRK